MDNWVVGVRTLRQSKIALGLCLLCVLFTACSREREVGIPLEDREKIAYFFQHAVFWDSYGYVLLGDKPCAISAYQRATWNPLSWLRFLSPSNLKMRSGWRTWCKYEKLVAHPHFMFFEEDSSVTWSHFIILVHRNKFLEKFQEAKKDFESVLPGLSGEDLLNSEAFFSEGLLNHDGLIGTILGYGRNNAWAFHAQTRPLQPYVDEREYARMENFCKRLSWWSLFLGTECSDLAHLPLPGFVADSQDPETARLKELYAKSKERILEHYQGRDFLDATLELLTNPETKGEEEAHAHP